LLPGSSYSCCIRKLDRNLHALVHNGASPRSMGLLGVAWANTAVGVSPETFLLLLLLQTVPTRTHHDSTRTHHICQVALQLQQVGHAEESKIGILSTEIVVGLELGQLEQSVRLPARALSIFLCLLPEVPSCHNALCSVQRAHTRVSVKSTIRCAMHTVRPTYYTRNHCYNLDRLRINAVFLNCMGFQTVRRWTPGV
jgi:hypothetical protein